MAQTTTEYVSNLWKQFGRPYVIDDLIRLRAADKEQVPILAYPKSEDSPVDYEHFTGQSLDRFIDHAAKLLLARGFKANDNSPIALLAPSNLDFVVVLFALSRLGYTVLCLSLRIPAIAIESLMTASGTTTLIHGLGPQTKRTVAELLELKKVVTFVTPNRAEYDKHDDEPRFSREFDPETETFKGGLILHSSGSTGMPKHIRLTHKAMMTHPPQGSGLKCFNALPWYHMYGLSTSFQAMWWRKTAYLYNASLPLTNKHLVAVLQTVKPEAVQGVPYVLKLVAETAIGVEELKACKLVTAAGARMPDELGNELVGQSITLGVVFGCTEAGLLGDTMRREPGDDTWEYLRIYANIRPFIYMKPIAPDQYELVYYKEHPALSVTNSNDPPGSFHSRDVFKPHPTIPDIWKYDCRIDDRVTLLNGEKVLPLPIEGRIRKHALVREAVVVGVDRAVPGLLAFKAVEADSLDDEVYIDAIWPAIAEANSNAEGFSQITREMIAVKPSNVDYAQTDKGNIIRAKVYAAFAETIEKLYANLDVLHDGTLELGLQETVEWLLKTFREEVGIFLENAESDFFSVGLDSLQATQGRRLIQKGMKLNGHKLSSNVVYDTGNVNQLAKYLHALQIGERIEVEDELDIMSRWIEEYSGIKPFSHNEMHGEENAMPNGTTKGSVNAHVEDHESERAPANGVAPDTTNGTIEDQVDQATEVYILTGASGSIGVHVLNKLIATPSTKHVYCFVRGSDPTARIESSLRQRGIALPASSISKITALVADPAQPRFGLPASVFSKLISTVTTLIHVAWPVNFNLPLQTFKPHVLGLHNMLRFSLSTPASAPARLIFCSTIGTAHAAPLPAVIPSVPLTDFSWPSPIGYSRSKLVCEHIVARAVKEHGAAALSLRIGQVVGDGARGIWNESEAMPLLIRSALAVGALPMLRERPTWVPVDIVADVFVDVLEGWKWDTRDVKVLNLVNPKDFGWEELLEKLREEGMEFETVTMGEWLKRMEQSEEKGQEAMNPGVKLLDYFKGIDRSASETLVFDTEEACKVSKALRGTPKVVEGDYIGKFLNSWSGSWGKVVKN